MNSEGENKSLFFGPWSDERLYLFFQTATVLFVWPIIQADYLYIDDSARAMLGVKGWAMDGRPLVEWLYAALTFSSSMVNIFPLPLLLSSVAMSLALRRLVKHYFNSPGLIECLVVLPLWFSPYFLQNLSYQYDGPVMALGLVAIIYAVTFDRGGSGRQILCSALLICAALAIYQICLNVFIGLACIEVYRCIGSGADARTVLKHVLFRGAQLVAGLSFYYVSGYQMVSGIRQGFIELNSSVGGVIQERMADMTEKVLLLFNEGNAWLFSLLAGMAVLGFLSSGYRVIAGRGYGFAALVILLVQAATLVGAILAVYGIDLLVHTSYPGARNMMGFSALLVFMMLLSREWAVSVKRFLALFLIVPIVFMLSFSYAYGRILASKKEFEMTVLQTINYDVVSHQELRELKNMWLVADTSYLWIPNAQLALDSNPAFAFVAGLDFLILPETMLRAGLVRFSGISSSPDNAFTCSGCVRLLSSRYYDIFIKEGSGYVVMKRWKAEPSTVRNH